MTDKFVFMNEDLVRLHGCVLHQLEASPESDLNMLTIAEKDMRQSLSTGIFRVSLTLLLKCVQDEQQREIAGRRGMTDAKVLLERYKYAARLETLRTKLQTNLT